ncbi:hypothetical protein KCP76_22460 [Salmonella enterica subsp. enterica serovar Weltevreden]|nr:hypothetical protein KCP76_22460 [Salmonella enterica subsp. enterica serovar Weltevreden]
MNLAPLEHLLSGTPGKMFSTSGASTRFLTPHGTLGRTEEQAAKQLGSLDSRDAER